MVSAVQVSIDVRWFETILALLAIVSADSSSLEVDPIPLKMGDTHFWQNQHEYALVLSKEDSRTGT